MKRRDFMRFFEAKAHGLHDTGNPLFPREVKRRRWWLIVGLAVGVAAVIAALAAAIYGPYFRLQTITIEGAKTLSADDLQANLQTELGRRNYVILPNNQRWFFNQARAEAELQQAFPLKSAVLQSHGHELQLSIVEDIFLLPDHSGDNVYFLDPHGTVTGLAAAGAGEGEVVQPDAPVLQEKIAATHAVGDQVFNANMIKNIIQFNEGLRSLGIQPTAFVSDDIQLPWLTVTSNESYVILFDATASVDTALTVLKAVRDEYLTTQEVPHTIDVRFGTRVYVR